MPRKVLNNADADAKAAAEFQKLFEQEMMIQQVDYVPLANQAKQMYEAFKAVKFTPNQAMELTIAILCRTLEITFGQSGRKD